MKLIRFNLIAGMHLERHGTPHEVVHALPGERLSIRNLRTRQTVTLTLGELAWEFMEGHAKQTDFAPKSQARDLLDSKNPSYVDLASLPEATHERIKRRIRYVQAVADLYPIAPKTPIFAHAIAQVSQVFNDKEPPSIHTVYRWLRRYVAAGYDVNAFARDAGVIRKRTSRLPEGVREQLAENLLAAFANPGASLHGAYDQVLEKTAKAMGFDGFQKSSGEIVYVARGHPEREANKKHTRSSYSNR